MSNKTIIGITSGDINGVGMDIILRTFSFNEMYEKFTPVLYANVHVFKFYKNLLNLENQPFYKIIKNIDECEENKLNLKICFEGEINITPGQASEQAGSFAFSSLKSALNDLKVQKIDVLCTSPIDKQTIKNNEFNFNGHTGYIANEFNIKNYLMMLVSDTLKVGLVTEHIPIKDVSSILSKELIIEKIEVMNKSLKEDFGITIPKIAVLGLNPHSGDKGIIGKEEIEIINPAVIAARDKGFEVWGSYSADGFFGNNSFLQFDAVLAMYHDQGLIPFKYISFEEGVNYTAGLPVIRTSPDHGTAYNIAGKGTASISSFTSALYMADKIHRQRLENIELNNNPLSFSKFKREKFSIGVPNIPRREL
ncbi:MAG: 4-hydroxythreonine-4-phosphate dehydrogenase PdxA [Bacteroidetes bacterium]|nr:4-hydroxythreonine-4-phosphate dehydrogenase PdxA [Bacteroidota bacterium]